MSAPRREPSGSLDSAGSPTPLELAEAVAALLDAPPTSRTDPRLEALLAHPGALVALAEEAALRAALSSGPPEPLTPVQVQEILAAMGVADDVSAWALAAGAAHSLGRVFAAGALPWQMPLWAGAGLARGAQGTWRGAAPGRAVQAAMSPLSGVRSPPRGRLERAGRAASLARGSLSVAGGSLSAVWRTARRVGSWL